MHIEFTKQQSSFQAVVWNDEMIVDVIVRDTAKLVAKDTIDMYPNLSNNIGKKTVAAIAKVLAL